MPPNVFVIQYGFHGSSLRCCLMSLAGRHAHAADGWFVAAKPSDLARAKAMLGVDPSADLDIGALSEVGDVLLCLWSNLGVHKGSVSPVVLCSDPRSPCLASSHAWHL